MNLFSTSSRILTHAISIQILQNCKRTFSHFNWLEKSKYLRTYRLKPPYPYGIVINRVAIRINKLILKFKKPKSSINMPPTPPESVRGMKILDKSAFSTVIEVPALDVPIKHVGLFQKIIKKFMLKLYGIRPVAEPSQYDIDRDNYRLFLLDPDKFKDVEDFKKTIGDTILMDKYEVDLSSWKILQVKLGYENWHHDDILQAILPKGSDGVKGFSTIGHIIHLNLKEELIEYKQIIGEVLLDKIPVARTVVNKTNTIDNTFRNFSMEVLAGKDEFTTVARQHGLEFHLDFSKVYWNPRLSTEHQRIVSQLEAGNVLYDVFAGIGPFSAPAVKKGCIVFANDLNPESFKWLQINAKPNKKNIPPELSNLDGREFIKTIVKNDLIKRWTESNSEEKTQTKIHVVMNLPALALEFLDSFRGLLSECRTAFPENVPLPMVHCYSFSKSEDPVGDIKVRVEDRIGFKLPEGHVIRSVRNVAPNKEMLCAEFLIPKQVLLEGSGIAPNDDEQPPKKKCKLQDSLVTNSDPEHF